jgi:16S rRNA (guanine527-N7)-methyltransferase
LPCALSLPGCPPASGGYVPRSAIPAGTALETLRREGPKILGRDLIDLELQQFSKYMDLLLKWQKIHRLIGSDEPIWIVNRVILDSLLFRRVLPADARKVLDAGSGAGIPAIPLKVVEPDLQLTMVESRQRRVSFLAAAIRELSLSGTQLLAGRLESVVRESPDQFDAVVARCAGDVGYLFGLGAHLVRPGGIVIASGPPKEHPLPAGQWITVPGVNPGEMRRFAVYRRP